MRLGQDLRVRDKLGRRSPYRWGVLLRYRRAEIDLKDNNSTLYMYRRFGGCDAADLSYSTGMTCQIFCNHLITWIRSAILDDVLIWADDDVVSGSFDGVINHLHQRWQV